jgi:hypothetical protein
VVVHHFIHSPTGKYSHFEIVPEHQPVGHGVLRAPFIDMGIPRVIARRDKLGCQLLVRSLKSVYFGDATMRMTPGRCESFFNDVSNFHLADDFSVRSRFL